MQSGKGGCQKLPAILSSKKLDDADVAFLHSRKPGFQRFSLIKRSENRFWVRAQADCDVRFCTKPGAMRFGDPW
jgi:hypothetical protein